MPMCAIRGAEVAGGMNAPLKEGALKTIQAFEGITIMAENTHAVTDDTFENEIEKHGGLAIVDFWATWCGPCRMIAPILEQLATEYAGKVKVAKLDVDTNIRTATRFNVRSIPLLLFFTMARSWTRSSAPCRRCPS